MLKILILMDKFKGTLTSLQAGGIVAEATGGEAVAVSDGGDGFLEAVLPQGGNIHEVAAHDAMMGEITTKYGIHQDTAYIESALVIGLSMLPKWRRNATAATTFGLGEVIKDALNKGARRIVIGLGGSATTDCGAGMMSALGAKFYGKGGLIWHICGGRLSMVESLDLSGLDKRLADVEFTACCDVDNVLFGEGGAAYCFAPQKGAGRLAVRKLNTALEDYAKIIEKSIGFGDFSFAGGGAAGGLGYCLKAFFNAQIKSGFDLLDLDERIQAADLIITGEGCFDAQSARGKLPYRVKQLSNRYNKRCICLCGCIDTNDFGDFDEVYYTYASPPKKLPTQKEAAENLRHLILNININR